MIKLLQLQLKVEKKTAWKVSKYEVFSGPYFPVFGLNTGKYGPGKTPYLDTFHVLVLRKILETIHFLSRQPLLFCGNWSKDSKREENSNFHQLLLLRSLDDQDLVRCLNSGSKIKYNLPEIQNKILKIMSLQVLREIAQNIRNSVTYTTTTDETADISNKVQLLLCMRWVDGNLVPYEKFIGMHSLVNTSADYIVLVIKDIFLQTNLKTENARGQCYDEASAVADSRSRLVTQLKSLNGKWLFVHCYGHALNLAIGDVIRNLKNSKKCFPQHTMYVN